LDLEVFRADADDTALGLGNKVCMDPPRSRPSDGQDVGKKSLIWIPKTKNANRNTKEAGNRMKQTKNYSWIHEKAEKFPLKHILETRAHYLFSVAPIYSKPSTLTALVS
jgi:hypothetical protein